MRIKLDKFYEIVEENAGKSCAEFMKKVDNECGVVTNSDIEKIQYYLDIYLKKEVVLGRDVDGLDHIIFNSVFVDDVMNMPEEILNLDFSDIENKILYDKRIYYITESVLMLYLEVMRVLSVDGFNKDVVDLNNCFFKLMQICTKFDTEGDSKIHDAVDKSLKTCLNILKGDDSNAWGFMFNGGKNK